MHELSICRAIAGIVTEHAAGRTVERVQLDVGHLRQVVPDTLIYCWAIVVADSPLADAQLDINDVPARLSCRSCGASTEISVPVFRCGSCQSIEVEVISGDELLVTSLELATDAASFNQSH